MLLNSANALHVGASTVDRVYLGATQVWPAAEFRFPSQSLGRPSALTVVDDGSTNLNLGFIFGCTVAGTRAIGLDVYMGAGVTMQPNLYANEDAVASASGLAVTADTDGWYRLPFSAAYTLQVGIDYTASVFQSATQKYSVANGEFPATVGPLYNTLAGSGRYSYGTEERPVLSSTTWYAIDVVAEPA